MVTTKSLLNVVASVVLLCISSSLVSADLPVHCLHVQISGKWVFELGDDIHDKSLRCGHNVPDTNLDHFTKDGFNLEVVKKIELVLDEPNIVTDSEGNKGTWTMIYDEGFEVRVHGKRYFAFSKYVPRTPESLAKDDVKDYISICDETLVGWFHNDDNTHWGCYHGVKVGELASATRFKTSAKTKSKKQNKIAPEENIKILSPTSFNNQPTILEKLQRDAMFEPDLSFIEIHNSDSNSLWKAGVHEQFLSKRMSDMHKLLGKHQKRVFSEKHHMGTRSKASRTSAAIPKDLPESLDWRNYNGVNYDSPVKNQGNCGSCYSMASIYAAETRVRILTKNRHRPSLSTQQVVSCSIYNQGCDGGYPFLVGKHGYDHGFVPESCFPYVGGDEVCRLVRSADCPDTQNPPIYRVHNYTYVGGYYGACNEALMMRELYEHGPIMVAFDAPSTLFYYNGGIFTGPAPPREGPIIPGVKQWQKTNHAVTCVGWGVDRQTGTKYWILKNTWGPQWGENGFFRIRRGTDECGIESMAVSIHIELPKQFRHLQD